MGGGGATLVPSTAPAKRQPLGFREETEGREKILSLKNGLERIFGDNVWFAEMSKAKGHNNYVTLRGKPRLC